MADTDRELLELAAKAAGDPIESWMEDGNGVPVAILASRNRWQPMLENQMTDCMGDALRLAVALRMTVQVVDHEIEVFDFERCLVSVAMSDGDDYQAETRRAIVRAAAAIGKAMDGSDGRERWMGVMEGSDG